MHKRYLFLGVVAVYLALLALLVWALNAHGYTLAHFAIGDGGDAWEYHTLGNSLNGGRFSLGILPEYFRTPGYPLFLAVLSRIPHALYFIVLAQILLVAASALLIADIGERLFAPWVGLLAALCYAGDPTVMLGTFMTLSDVLFVFILLACVRLILTPIRGYRGALYLGALCGYLILVRPLGEFVVPLLALWYATATFHTLQQSTVRAAAAAVCVLLAAAAVVVPWMIRNTREGNHFALSTAGPYNMLFYNIAEYEVSRGAGSRDAIHSKLTAEVGTTSDALLRDFSYSDRIAIATGHELQGRVVSYAFFHIIKTVPFYIGSSVQGVLRALHQQGALTGPEAPAVNTSSLILQGHIGEAVVALVRNPFGMLERLGWITVLLLDLVALVLARKEQRMALVYMALLALAFGILTGPVSFPRYRLPAEPFLFIAAGGGLWLLLQEHHRKMMFVWQKK